MLRTKEIIEKFKLNVVNQETADLDKEINSPAIHRAGLDLVGAAKISSCHNNIIGWGTKENNYLKSLSAKEREVTIKRVVTSNTPLIVLSLGVEDAIANEISKIADEFKVAVCKTKIHLAAVSSTIGWYVVKYLAESLSIHGSLVSVNGIGVMIIGKSGIGKSEAVIELIQKGSKFICDDTVILKRIGNEFLGEPAELTKNFLEARGIGFIDIPKIYGLQAMLDSSKVDLVIELVPSEQLNKVDRLGDANLKYEALGSSLPLVQIPVQNGRSLSALIEAAVNVYIARVHGHDPMQIIAERSKNGSK